MKLKIENAARRAIRGLPEHWRKLIVESILDLEDNPYPDNSMQLRTKQSYRRLKVPPYRVIYRVGTSTVFIERVEKRSDITYRGFNPQS